VTQNHALQQSPDLGITPVQLELLHRMLGRDYVLKGEIGRGGTSIVYLAQDERRGRAVAVKVLRRDLAASVGATRFLREVEIVQKLAHPRILPIYESGSHEDDLFYTMPFVEGRSLRERLMAEPQLPLTDALAIARQVAEALEYAHERGIIHRDIKPANILIGKDGVLVADFGVARAISVATGDQITDSDVVIGTPEYMSPEQATGQRHLDGRVDIYALGCVLYYMVAGEPPFTGPTVQAVIARHCQDAPRSVRVIRPSVPLALERLLMKALAKVPADRFATAGEFISAIDAIDLSADGNVPASSARTSRRWPIALGVTATLAVLWTAWLLLLKTGPPLDPDRILVFPPHAPGAEQDDGAAEAVATFIGYALEETRPLKWLEAGAVIGDRDRDLSRLGEKEAARIARKAHAAYFIDGTILRRPDSVTVVLRLHDSRGDSVVQTVGASGPPSAYLPQLGLRSIAGLLPTILQPGRTIDLRSLSDRSTTAVANFLQGEREYRRMQFPSAIKHYEMAIAEDSEFALAAFKGAQTATWLSESGTDTLMAGLAARRAQALSPAQAELIRGLRSYVVGDADSALVYLRRAVAADTTLAVAWALMGEIYARSLTSETPADSLARTALGRARRLDRDFAPTLLLLEEIALREGNLSEARELRRDLARAGADTTHAVERKLVWSCVEKGVGSVDWAAAAREDALTTLNVGRILARAGSRIDCARAAFNAALRSGSASTAVRNGALLAINGVLLAGDRTNQLDTVLASTSVADLRRWPLYLMDAAVGLGFDRQAGIAADSIGRAYVTLDGPTLWYLGSLAARRGSASQLIEIASALRAKSDSSHSKRDRLLAQLIDARLVLAQGDTDTAITKLSALKSVAVRRDIAWQPWAVLGVERLLLAELLLARGRYRESLRVATQLDATEPVPYLLYLRPSLDLRLRAARRLGDAKLAARYEERLQLLKQ